MQRRKLNGSWSRARRNGATPVIDEPGQPAAGALHSLQFTEDGQGIGRRKDPDWVLADAGERLQSAVNELEDLMFEAPGVGPRSRTQIHDAVALMMEALQALGKARTTLQRSPALAAPLLSRPLARA